MANNKNWIEIILMPLVIALVGVAGTYFITQQQEKNANTMRETQLENTREMAEADREIKILELFTEKITSQDENQRLMALRMLRAINADLAERLAKAVSEAEPENTEIRKVADQIADEAKAVRTGVPRIFFHIQTEEDRAPAKNIALKLQESGYIIPGIERLVDKGPKTSQLRYFRKSEAKIAEEIVENLKTYGVEVKSKYISGYETSPLIRPGHFEIWFAPGKLEK